MTLDIQTAEKPVQNSSATLKLDRALPNQVEPLVKRLLATVRTAFKKHIDKRERACTPDDRRDSRNVNGKITIVDSLMSALAMFGMKCTSLLQFDQRKEEEPIRHNLRTLYLVDKAPSDTHMRKQLDPVNPEQVRPAFKKVFTSIQRGKGLEKYRYLNEGYIVAIDGTGQFSSSNVCCKHCCSKHHSNGTVTYYHQAFQGAIVHPDRREVIPFCPEPIVKGDGDEKNDCELNAMKRFVRDLRREHPHLDIVITADAIGANGPYIREILAHKMSYIIAAKPDGNKSLFDFLSGVGLDEHHFKDKGLAHVMRWAHDVPLNDTHPDLLVNFLEYEERNLKTGEVRRWTWVTNIRITKVNAFELTRAGRSKWKIENEAFNTLKNQGYDLEHNYGHGQENLNTIFVMLMMLAFLIDQAQQLMCGYFQRALEKEKSRKRLWEKMLSLFTTHLIMSWEDLYLAISGKYRVHPLVVDTS